MDSPARAETFPAAHSMDTTWFAVDDDGHIGVFDTGPEGPAPRDLGVSSDRTAMEQIRSGLRTFTRDGNARVSGRHDNADLLQLHLLMHGSESGLDFLRNHLRGRHILDVGAPDRRRLSEYWASLEEGDSLHFPIAMLLPNRDDLEALQWRDGYVRSLETETLCWVYDLSWFDHQLLHEVGACAGCGWWKIGSDFEYPWEFDERQLGLFLFEHQDRIPNDVYCLVGQPTSPLRINDLSNDIATVFDSLRLRGANFASGTVQPFEHGPCVTWGTGW